MKKIFQSFQKNTETNKQFGSKLKKLGLGITLGGGAVIGGTAEFADPDILTLLPPNLIFIILALNTISGIVTTIYGNKIEQD